MTPNTSPHLSRDQVLDLAGAVLSSVTELAKNLPRNGRSLPSHYAILCYSTIIQDTTACLLLMRQGLWGTVQKILRSIIESYMHLKNITRDEAYINTAIREACVGLKKYVKPHEERKVSPGLIMVEDEIRKCKDTIIGYERMIANRWKDKSNLEQYKDAGIESFYVYSYSKYSRAIHSNLLALLDCHTQNTDCRDIVVAKDCTDLEFFTMVSEFVHILQDASDVISSFCNIELDEESKRYQRLSVLCTTRIQAELREILRASKC